LENRRQRDVVLHERLEREVDALHQKLEEQVRGEAERLQACKLAALAEFAAGAGHEINNPLAVISGQAQYLLGHLEKEDGGKIKDETSPDPPIPSFLLHPPAFRKSLQTIITQARRIHDLLREVMQFARPPLPRKALVDLVALVAEVAASLTDLAARRGVRLEAPAYGAAGPIPIYADEEQVRVALACLLRNAIEAASEGGWARVFFLKTVSEEGIDVAVEDSGPGPAPEQREHLFDPFYSGRSAGRGRGLGLPTAWRLTRLQGGDVRLAPRQNGEPTRFVLTLPRHSGEANPDKNPPLVQSVSQSGDSASPLILPAPSAEAIGLADSA
jgi:signal transduction histidine kinase